MGFPVVKTPKRPNDMVLKLEKHKIFGQSKLSLAMHGDRITIKGDRKLLGNLCGSHW
jgi:hypothetical protein